MGTHLLRRYVPDRDGLSLREVLLIAGEGLRNGEIRNGEIRNGEIRNGDTRPSEVCPRSGWVVA